MLDAVVSLLRQLQTCLSNTLVQSSMLPSGLRISCARTAAISPRASMLRDASRCCSASLRAVTSRRIRTYWFGIECPFVQNGSVCRVVLRIDRQRADYFPRPA